MPRARTLGSMAAHHDTDAPDATTFDPDPSPATTAVHATPGGASGVAARRGRRAKLDDEVERKLTQAIAAGNYMEASCVYAGISPGTLVRWLQLGAERPKSRYGTLRDRVERAQASAEVRIVAQWQAHMPRNWVACAAFLERRFPERWARFRQTGESKGVTVNVQQAMGALVASGSPQSGALASHEARAALMELVANMTPDEERSLLADYDRLREAAGALPVHPGAAPSSDDDPDDSAIVAAGVPVPGGGDA